MGLALAVTTLLTAAEEADAPAANAGRTITREDARVLALGYSPTLKKAHLSLERSRLDQRSFYFRYLPSLNAGARGSLPFLDSAAEPKLAGKDKATVSASAGLTESVTIFDAGQTCLEKESLNLSTASLEAAQIKAVYDVLDDVDGAFYDCLAAEAELDAARISSDVAQAAYQMVLIKQQNGLASRADYLAAAATKTSAENALLTAQRDVSLKRLALSNITGKTIADTDTLGAIDFGRYADFTAHISTLNAAGEQKLYHTIEDAFKRNNPRQRTAALTLAQAELALSQSKRACSPTLSASATFDLSYQIYPKPSDARLGYNGSVSIAATIPLDVWVKETAIEKSALAAESAHLDYQQSMDTFRVEVRSALYTLISGARSIASSRTAAEYARARLDAQQELYRLGSAPLSDLLDASQSYTNAANARSTAEYTFFRSLSTMRSLCVIESEHDLLALLGVN